MSQSVLHFLFFFRPHRNILKKHDGQQARLHNDYFFRRARTRKTNSGLSVAHQGGPKLKADRQPLVPEEEGKKTGL